MTKSIFKKIQSVFLLAILFLGSVISAVAQLPQNIDPGQEANPPSLWQNPRYIVPIAVIVVLLVGYGWLRRRKRK